jgi:hypothetical protein
MSNPIEKPAASPELLEAAKSLAAIVFRQCGGYSGGPGRDALDAAQALRAAIAAEEARKPAAPASLIDADFVDRVCDRVGTQDFGDARRTDVCLAVLAEIAKAEPAADVDECERLRTAIIGHCALLTGRTEHAHSEIDCLGEVHTQFEQMRTERDEAVARAEKEESYHREFFNRAQDAELKLREASGDDKLRKLRDEMSNEWPCVDDSNAMDALTWLLARADRLLAEPAAGAKDAFDFLKDEPDLYTEPERDDGPLVALLDHQPRRELDGDMPWLDDLDAAMRELCRRALEGGGNG